jgi:hypothetical protein
VNPTLIGLFAVLVWGAALPIIRILQQQIGAVAVIGTIFCLCGVLGILKQKMLDKKSIQQEVFRNPFLYGRWIFFVQHIVSLHTLPPLS